MSAPKRSLLLIDDDTQNLSLLSEFLSPRYDVRAISDPRQGVEAAISRPPSLIVCDIDMPGMNGFEVCEAVRAATPGAMLPFVFLTSDPQASSMRRALAAGGSDYLLKPFRLKELLERIELRLGLSYAGAPTRSGNLSLDPAEGTARIQRRWGSRTREREVRLTARAFKVLEALVRNEGRLMSREQLLSEAWGSQAAEEGASDRAVDLHVFRLRKLLAGWDREIQAVYGRGYCIAERSAQKAASVRGKRAR